MSKCGRAMRAQESLGGRPLWEAALRLLGLDASVAYTIAARLAQLVGGLGSALLVVRLLSPLEQGYYYTLISLAALQTVFEMGFSIVVLQTAAHESARIAYAPDGTVTGEAWALARLGALLRLTARWSLCVALAAPLLLAPAGALVFARRAAFGVLWAPPWLAAVVAVDLYFAATPFCAFLEGCGAIRAAARLRLLQALAVLAASWLAIGLGRSLYACASVNAAAALVAAVFLWRRRRLLRQLWRASAEYGPLAWRAELWPFQWRLGISSVCAFLTAQALTPLLFAGRGAPAAGRFGLTMSVASYLPVLGLCWVAPKAAALGRAIGQGCGAEARRIFEGALLRALAAIAALSVSGLLLVVALQRRAPALAARLEPPGVLALLLLASCGAFAVQSLGVYLRAFRREPYLGLSLVTAALTLSGGLVAARLGGGAMALDYLLWNGLLALVWAATLYRKGLRASSLVAGKRLEASVSARLVR